MIAILETTPSASWLQPNYNSNGSISCGIFKYTTKVNKWSILKENFEYQCYVKRKNTKSCSSHLRILIQMYDKILKLWKIMLIHPLMIPGCITNAPITSTSAKTTFFKTRSISTNVTPNIHSGYQLRQDIWISEPIMWLCSLRIQFC